MGNQTTFVRAPPPPLLMNWLVEVEKGSTVRVIPGVSRCPYFPCGLLGYVYSGAYHGTLAKHLGLHSLVTSQGSTGWFPWWKGCPKTQSACARDVVPIVCLSNPWHASKKRCCVLLPTKNDQTQKDRKSMNSDVSE